MKSETCTIRAKRRLDPFLLVDGLQGIIPVFQSLNKYMDVGELLSDIVASSSELQSLIKEGFSIRMGFKI